MVTNIEECLVLFIRERLDLIIQFGPLAHQMWKVEAQQFNHEKRTFESLTLSNRSVHRSFWIG